MKAVVDEHQRVVRVEGQSWPFELDCRTGTVALALEGTTLVLRRHSWREKRNMAHFAHLGENFLKHQFLQLSLVDEGLLPENKAAREALWVLARWMNGPQEKVVLPLDQALLATVTLELCRAMAISPAALEDLEAAEVEALWQAAGGERRPAADPSPGTRIVVVPDPEMAESENAVISTRQDRSGANAESVVFGRQQKSSSLPAGEEAAATPAKPLKAVSQPPTSGQKGATANDPTRASDSTAKSLSEVGKAISRDLNPASPVTGTGRPSPRGRQGRFRVILETVPDNREENRTASTVCGQPQISSSGPDTMPTSAIPAPASAWTSNRLLDANTPTPWPVATEPSTTAVAVTPVSNDRPASNKLSDPAANQDLVLPAGKTLEAGPERGWEARYDLEALLDKLADRLEEAAGVMGIDLEP